MDKHFLLLKNTKSIFILKPIFAFSIIMIEIKQIEAAESIEIRSQVLRPGQAISACIYPHDNDEESFHLGAYFDGKLVSIVSFYLENHPNFKEEGQYRFRGMATLPNYRGKGLARAMLSEAFKKIKLIKSPLVWCNARILAVNLYEKLGMEIASEQFDIPGIGPHYLMIKKIN